MKIIFRQKLIENIRANNNRWRNIDPYIFDAIADTFVVDQQIEESQSASFAAERSSANSREAHSGIKRIFAEIGDLADLLKTPVFLQRVNDVFAQVIHGGVIRNFSRAQLVR